MTHSAVTLNINLSPLPSGEHNFEQVPENTAGKSAGSSWQSERGSCIYMKKKLSEENGSNEMLFLLHGSVSALNCAWRIPPSLQTHRARNATFPPKRQTGWTVLWENTCISLKKDMPSGIMDSLSKSTWKQDKSCFSVCLQHGDMID